MKLWLLTPRTEFIPADVSGHYIEAVVAAETEAQARRIHPDKYEKEDWWKRNPPEKWDNEWVTPDQLDIHLLGNAAPDVKKGVILAEWIDCRI